MKSGPDKIASSTIYSALLKRNKFRLAILLATFCDEEASVCDGDVSLRLKIVNIGVLIARENEKFDFYRICLYQVFY